MIGGIDWGQLELTTYRRVNCGSGDFPMRAFVNIDEDASKPAVMHMHVPPLPFDTNSMEMVWGSHFLEHLSRDDATYFLAEAHRVLAPGGKLGLVVPDTREVMRRYVSNSIDAVEQVDGWHNVNDLEEVCRVFLYSTIQESPHRWSWDLPTLARAMTDAGFTNLQEIDRFRDIRLVQGVWFQCGLEGTK